MTNEKILENEQLDKVAGGEKINFTHNRDQALDNHPLGFLPSRIFAL